MDSETLIDAYNDYKKRELEQTPEEAYEWLYDTVSAHAN